MAQTSNLVTVTDASFAADVEAAPVAVVDFGADWCPPCRMIAPVLEQLATAWAGRAVIGALDVDENPETAARFGVRSLPTVLFFRNGVEVDRVVGAAPRAVYLERLEATFAGG